jgi:hypothetical protein
VPGGEQPNGTGGASGGEVPGGEQPGEVPTGTGGASGGEVPGGESPEVPGGGGISGFPDTDTPNSGRVRGQAALASTGVPVEAVAGGGAALVVAGGLLVYAGRTRRRPSPRPRIAEAG